jgi:hypothetical protein
MYFYVHTFKIRLSAFNFTAMQPENRKFHRISLESYHLHPSRRPVVYSNVYNKQGRKTGIEAPDFRRCIHVKISVSTTCIFKSIKRDRESVSRRWRGTTTVAVKQGELRTCQIRIQLCVGQEVPWEINEMASDIPQDLLRHANVGDLLSFHLFEGLNAVIWRQWEHLTKKIRIILSCFEPYVIPNRGKQLGKGTR